MDGTERRVKETKVALKEVMGREIDVLRELLGSMYEEQQAHLQNNPSTIKSLLVQREKMLQTMAREREERLILVAKLYELLTGEDLDEQDEHESLDILREYASSESCEILILRDQMLALIEQMTEQGTRNNYLIEGKIAHTRELLQRIHPSQPNPTYSKEGIQRKGPKTKVSIINREV